MGRGGHHGLPLWFCEMSPGKAHFIKSGFPSTCPALPCKTFKGWKSQKHCHKLHRGGGGGTACCTAPTPWACPRAAPLAQRHSSQAVSHAAASHFPFSFRSHPDGSVADVLLTEQLSQWWGAQFGLF